MQKCIMRIAKTANNVVASRRMLELFVCEIGTATKCQKKILCKKKACFPWWKTRQILLIRCREFSKCVP